MQKIAKKASVLIWSIFLSLMLSISFISISTQINKNLKENSEIKESISINSSIKQTIQDAIINKNYDNIELSESEVIIFEKSNYLEQTLKENEEVEINIINDTNITIIVNEGSPIEYYNESRSIDNITDSGETFYISDNQKLTIKNLGGYSNIIITGENDFESEYKYYSIIEKIGNKNIVKEKGKIKVF